MEVGYFVTDPVVALRQYKAKMINGMQSEGPKIVVRYESP